MTIFFLYSQKDSLAKKSLISHAETQLEEFGTWEYASNYLPAISTVSYTSTLQKLKSVFWDNATSFSFHYFCIALSHQIFFHTIKIFSPFFLIFSLYLCYYFLFSIKKYCETVLMHCSHMLTKETTCTLFSQKFTDELIPVQEILFLLSNNSCWIFL